MLLITSTRLLWAAAADGKQLVKLNFMVERVLMVQATVTELTEKEDNAALAALGKSEGKVMVKELPAGTGFLVCMVKV